MICCNIKKLIIAGMSVVAMIILTITCVISAGAVDNENTTEIDYYYGDANNDSAVNVKDCTYIQKYLNNVVKPENYDYFAIVSDINGDGEVDIKDVTYLQKLIVGINPLRPDPAETTTTTSKAPTTAPPITDDEGYNNHIYRP